MSLSMRPEPVAPQTIAGGFVLIPVRRIMATWRACQQSPLSIADFRTWLACREMLARRCTLDHVRASGEPRDRIQALERRVSAERETIRALESRGELRFEEIARVMEDVDRRG